MGWVIAILITIAPIAVFFAGVHLVSRTATKAGKKHFKQCPNCKLPMPKGAGVCGQCGRDYA